MQPFHAARPIESIQRVASGLLLDKSGWNNQGRQAGNRS